ncbi:MAG: hypothetical protein A2Z14_08080 [Chloroflexi bacterium RBG_16_48_8]|nr:MAG: hypothetical protein A2Z14_08080 [Chloroflexi bacterium RBG_16_48_8]
MMANEPKILIVDDDAVLLDLMSRRMEKMGYKSDRAHDGDEAIKSIESNSYDLVITDIYMPKMSGIELIGMIKKKDPETQVIVITGGAMIEMALEALEKGADAYMSKPFDHLKIFDHTVVKALEYRKLLRYRAQVQQTDSSKKTKNRNQLGREGDVDEIKQIIECMPQALLIVDANGDIVAANSAAEELIGFGWNVRAIEPQAFRAALNGGPGAPVHVNGAEYKLKAVELAKENGAIQILFMLQSVLGLQLGGYERAHKYLEVLKTCLSWFYKQRLREKEFQALRAMAVQVQKLEQVHNGSYKKANRLNGLTESLPEMQDLSRVLSDGSQ